MKKKNPILIIVSGPALSGKSTLLGNIQSQIPEMIVVSTDDIRMELYQSYDFKLEKEPEIWTITHQRIAQFLEQGHVVAMDATLRLHQLRKEISERYQNIPMLYLAFERLSLNTLFQRNELRKWKQFSPEVIKKMHEDYEFPTPNELQRYKKFFVIKTSEIESTLPDVIHWIKHYHFMKE